MDQLPVTPGYAAAALRTELAERWAPARTALVVVDMQNDFCAPGGYIERLGRDVSGFPALIAPIERALAVARRVGAQVLWLRAVYEDALVPPSMLAQKRKLGVTATCCARGSWGYAPFGVAPAANEPVFDKHTYSGFSSAAFAQHLRETGVEAILFCGVQTNICVESTLRDAHARGFYVGLVADAVGSHTPQLHEATLANVRFLFGDVMTSHELAALWPAP